MHETSNKKEIQNKKDKKRKEKEKKRLERKENSKKSGGLDDMIAYVDQYGNITSEPQDLSKRETINAEDIEIKVERNRNDEPQATIRKGIITFFNDSKGFGFIKDLDTQESIFVHLKGLLEPVKEDNKVVFEVEKGLKGLNAYNVKIDRS
ncbi:MAG TPA: cold shock domain-containing protein [Bacteroidales bacterium]|nr:cold shock domain-containing protein [Bacteroidales bacterium]